MLTQRGEAGSPLAALKESGTHLSFQPLDALSQGRLAEAEGFGGAPKVQMLGQDEESVPEVHIH